MAFLPFSYDDGQPRPFEYYKLAESGDIEIGTVMALEDGKLTGAAKGAYICMRTESGAAADSVTPVMRLGGGVVFEAPLAQDAPTLAPGARCEGTEDGRSLGDAADSGCWEIVDMDGTQAQDLCRVRFVEA